MRIGLPNAKKCIRYANDIASGPHDYKDPITSRYTGVKITVESSKKICLIFDIRVASISEQSNFLLLNVACQFCFESQSKCISIWMGIQIHFDL